MKLRQLKDQLNALGEYFDDAEVYLEVGGDGAFHKDTAKRVIPINTRSTAPEVVLTSE